jgi:hypothetical protein
MESSSIPKKERALLVGDQQQIPVPHPGLFDEGDLGPTLSL